MTYNNKLPVAQCCYRLLSEHPGTMSYWRSSVKHGGQYCSVSICQHKYIVNLWKARKRTVSQRHFSHWIFLQMFHIVQHFLISNVTCYHGNLMLRKGSISTISSYLVAEAGLLWKCSNSFLIIMHLEEE